MTHVLIVSRKSKALETWEAAAIMDPVRALDPANVFSTTVCLSCYLGTVASDIDAVRRAVAPLAWVFTSARDRRLARLAKKYREVKIARQLLRAHTRAVRQPSAPVAVAA